MQEILEHILGKKIQILSQAPLSGGDINAVSKIRTNHGTFCVKQNLRKQFPMMLEKESIGLNELAKKTKFHIPEVISHSEDRLHQYLLLEYIESGSKSFNFWEDFGTRLAHMHQQTSDQFGWDEDNYIGSLHQSNKLHNDWANFYAEERILPQVKLAFDSNQVDSVFVQSAEKLCLKLDELFPKEAPALLHGDLWSGNFMVNANGDPVLIDPAVYYGHREMDLGMMYLFGGFSDSLFRSYDQLFPLEKNWENRIPLAQLYPLLVHVNLFGGGYIKSAASVIHQYC